MRAHGSLFLQNAIWRNRLADSFFFDVDVEFESAFNLLVAVAIVDADKVVVEDILKTIVSEPTQKTAIKFKVYDLQGDILYFVTGLKKANDLETHDLRTTPMGENKQKE